jgi:predicted lipoprotein with Yx(FWY)xxD motif
VKNPFMSVAAAAALVLLVGCGSSTKSSSTTASTAAAASSQASPASTSSSSPAAAPAATSSEGAAVTVTTKPAKLGTILAAGPKKMTVYLFEADSSGRSACSGACEAIWPPVTTGAAARAAGAASSADLGTISRANGSKQITYKGHPLYFFAKDKDGGDAYGQDSHAFGAGWYVLGPNGAKIEQHKSGGGS